MRAQQPPDFLRELRKQTSLDALVACNTTLDGIEDLINEVETLTSGSKKSKQSRLDNKEVAVKNLRDALGIESSYETFVEVGKALVELVNRNRRMLRRFAGFDASFFAGLFSATTRHPRRAMVSYKGFIASCEPVECLIDDTQFKLYAIFNERNIAFRLVSDLGVSDVFVIAFVGKNAKPACFCGRELVSFESAKDPDYEPCALTADGSLVNTSIFIDNPDMSVTLYGNNDFNTLLEAVNVVSYGRI